MVSVRLPELRSYSSDSKTASGSIASVVTGSMMMLARPDERATILSGVSCDATRRPTEAQYSICSAVLLCMSFPVVEAAFIRSACSLTGECAFAMSPSSSLQTVLSVALCYGGVYFVCGSRRVSGFEPAPQAIRMLLGGGVLG